MAGQETRSDKTKARCSEGTCSLTPNWQPAMSERQQWVLRKQPQQQEWRVSARTTTRSTSSGRRLAWCAISAFLGAWFIAFLRFFLPRTLFEPPTVFKIGYPSDYSLGVDTKFQQKYRVWVDRTPDRLFVIYARCTHLGCTPDWKASENKFKCPCHGSGYDNEGVNFEGPAPRPMDRAHVELAPDGQIVVDVSRLYQWPKGQAGHFNDPGSFLST